MLQRTGWLEGAAFTRLDTAKHNALQITKLLQHMDHLPHLIDGYPEFVRKTDKVDR